MKQYRIMVHDDGGDDGRGLRSFADWLRYDDAIRSSALISIERKPPRPGEMGAGLDAIQLMVDGGFQLANLAVAYTTWRRSRTRRSTVTIEHSGTRVVLNDADPETIARVLESLGRE